MMIFALTCSLADFWGSSNIEILFEKVLNFFSLNFLLAASSLSGCTRLLKHHISYWYKSTMTKMITENTITAANTPWPIFLLV